MAKQATGAVNGEAVLEHGGRMCRDMEDALIKELTRPDTKFTKDWFLTHSLRETADAMSPAFPAVLSAFGKSGLSASNAGRLGRRLGFPTARQVIMEENKKNPKPPKAPKPAATDGLPPTAVGDLVRMYQSIGRALVGLEAKIDQIALKLGLPPLPVEEGEPAYQAQ